MSGLTEGLSSIGSFASESFSSVGSFASESFSSVGSFFESGPVRYGPTVTGSGIPSSSGFLDGLSGFATAATSISELVGSVASVSTNIAGTYAQSSAQEAQAESDASALNYQANVSRVEADQADERAIEERATASQDAAERYRQIGLQQSRALLVGAAGGSDASSGDILQTIAKFEGLGTREALNTLKEGDSRALQYKKRASALRRDAENLDYNAASRLRAGKARARATIIGGAGDLLSNKSFQSYF